MYIWLYYCTWCVICILSEEDVARAIEATTAAEEIHHRREKDIAKREEKLIETEKRSKDSMKKNMELFNDREAKVYNFSPYF